MPAGVSARSVRCSNGSTGTWWRRRCNDKRIRVNIRVPEPPIKTITRIWRVATGKLESCGDGRIPRAYPGEGNARRLAEALFDNSPVAGREFATMNHISDGLFALLPVSLSLSAAAHAADDYQPGPDSVAQPGVPKGEILTFTFDQSKIFPGTTREYSIYVPAQYTGDKPACLFVSQDGIKHN